MTHDNASISDDTICAISTPPGAGGIAVVRISGPRAIEIADSVWKGTPLASLPSRKASLGRIVDTDSGEEVDTGVATLFRGPCSFTGEDTVEFSVHGSQWIQAEMLRLLIRKGCVMARPGEFTRRAFANGRMDLAEAEAVADVIAASTRSAHRLAASQMRGDFSRRLASLRDMLLDISALLELELDFSEEEVEFASRGRLIELATEIHTEVGRLADSFATGNAIRTGIPVAIVGDTNAGKSTLLNRLLSHDRAIVSDIRGTTRDTIEDTVEIDGTLFRFIDTAGIRETDDPVENLGIERSIRALGDSRIALWVTDATDAESAIRPAENIINALSADTRLIVVVNKMDLVGDGRVVIPDGLPEGSKRVEISAATGEGIAELRKAIVEASGIDQIAADGVTVTNARHYEALTHARESIGRVIDGLRSNLSGDFIAQDLRETIHHLGEITGTVTTPDILATIFSRFCIGK